MGCISTWATPTLVARGAYPGTVAGHRALEAVALSVVALLNRQVEQSADPTSRPTALLVGPGAPQLSHRGSGAAIVVHPYRVAIDPTIGRGTALQLRLLVSASAEDPETELAALGLAVTVLESTPVLAGDLLDPVGAWDPAVDQVRLAPVPVDAAELTDVFAALGLPARPAVVYEAAGIVVDGRAAT